MPENGQKKPFQSGLCVVADSAGIVVSVGCVAKLYSGRGSFLRF
jgi:hypothetical protein